MTIWRKSIIKSFFEETKFSTKQTFLRKKLFNEVNFSKKQTFRQNKLFVNETNFSSKQLFQCNKLFNKTNILTKHTFWWNKLFYETNFEIKQTLLLIYYSDYWNLKFVIDSFFVSFKIHQKLKNALDFSYNSHMCSTFSALQEHYWVRLWPASWTKSWTQGVKFQSP